MIYTIPENDKHRIFTLDEVNTVFTAPRDIYNDCTKILLYSGFRVEELLRLNRSDICLDDMYFQGGLKTKAGKSRIVPIHHEIMPIVAEYCTTKDGDKVFPISQSKLWEVMVSRYAHLPHDTRHTFISELQSRGADHICIERLVGHSSKGVTDKVYTHKDIQELRQTVELLAYKDIQASVI